MPGGVGGVASRGVPLSRSIRTLALGAISVASAMFLILDLTQPYSGLFRVPPSAIQQTLEAIER